MNVATDPEPFAERRRARVGEADAWLSTLFDDAVAAAGAATTGVSVVAVGGYGRAELSAGSDLDVLLLYDQRCANVDQVAERLWYPLWDAGVALDHSVRTVEETTEAAERDLRTALSVLDARHVAGDTALTLRLRTTLLADWRRLGPNRLRELETAARERAELAGEVAALLEPDLKNAHGGLRDGVILRAVAATWLVDVPHAQLARARSVLLDVRDALQDVAGRRHRNRLLTEFQPEVARRLGLPGRHELLRRVYAAARTIGHLGDLVWRRVGQALSARVKRRPSSRPRPGPVLTPLARGVAVADEEVVLDSRAAPSQDPVLPLRAAAAAATRGLAISPYSCAQLARESAELGSPWPESARRELSALLGAGPSLISTWEAMDQAGLIDRLLPEWKLVRDYPQSSPVHQFTLDRHLLQTCVQASALVRRVSRPDLLVLTALLHDIGKAQPGDHSVVGAELASDILTRLGYGPDEAATVVGLVRHHLLLVDTATRRDLDDPATIDAVVAAVPDLDTLDLLAALTEADARATGPAAWTSWRAGLVTQLVDRARSRLERRPSAPPVELEKWQRELVRGVGVRGRLDVAVDDAWGSKRVTVGAPDGAGPSRSAVLAATAGVLATSGVSIRSATLRVVRDRGGEVGVAVWSVDKEPSEPRALRERIEAVLGGRIDLESMLRARDAAYSTPATPATPPADPALPTDSVEPGPQVRVLAGASASATVLEVRAHDRPGLFYRICRALAEQDCSVRSAHVSTWGVDVVDVFYLTDGHGRPLSKRRATAVVERIASSLS